MDKLQRRFHIHRTIKNGHSRGIAADVADISGDAGGTVAELIVADNCQVV